MTATTALTQQNTTGVKGVHVVPTGFVEGQIEAVVEDIAVDVVKTGVFALPQPDDAGDKRSDGPDMCCRGQLLTE